MRSVKRSPSNEGFLHLGGDGVFRSFNSHREVIDYKQLSPEQIELVVKSTKELIDAESFKKLDEKMQGVDGRDVIDVEQLLHPGPEGRPLGMDLS